ncbi:hypothetical protein [Thalassovita sp.]|uniref:hypothetical protein n=1 Tax=Thalassovita sp. TaxID=1979401 RepID=UPI002B271B16|nr:hypothetical protein [Thalassovita sp.]
MAGKTCFVISPIGDKNTPVRRQADCALEYIIKPAITELGYDEPTRVDRLDKPTHITTEIVQHLVSADMVIADLSGSNPNVFYELGIRHAYAKPCIMLSNWDPQPPFDVGHTNIIKYTHDDPTSHAEARDRIKHQITQLSGGTPVSNPVTLAEGISKLESSGDDKDQIIAALTKQMDELSGRVATVETASVQALRGFGRNALLDISNLDEGRDFLSWSSHDAPGHNKIRLAKIPSIFEFDEAAADIDEHFGQINKGSDEGGNQ